MFNRSKREESLPVEVIPGVSESHIEISHALAHIDILVAVVPLLTDGAVLNTHLYKSSQSLSGQDVARSSRKISSKHLEVVTEVNGVTGVVVL